MGTGQLNSSTPVSPFRRRTKWGSAAGWPLARFEIVTLHMSMEEGRLFAIKIIT